MLCDIARELFSEYLEGGTDHSQTKHVCDHIGQCESCRRDFDLFRQTWQTLSVLPEIKPPSGFRHDVVMRVARQQHEHAQNARLSVSSIGRFLNIGNLRPVRALAVACAAVALVVVLLRIPESAYEHFSGMLSPSIGVIDSTKSEKSTDVIEASPLSQLESVHKREWQARKLRRNSVWVTIEPCENGNGTTLYKVMLSINSAALLVNETTARIGGKVFLLPADRIGYDAINSATQVWEGNILNDSPVLVPVIVDQSRNSAGSVNLLVTWKFRQRNFAQIIFIPMQDRATDSTNVFDFSAKSTSFTQTNGDIYSLLCSITKDYGVSIIANAYLTEKPWQTNLAGGSLDQALRSTLEPVGIDWLYADKAIYVDRKYDVKVLD